MPNTENIDKLIAAIKAKPTHFKMDTWINGDVLHDCGTAACLGGWAIILAKDAAGSQGGPTYEQESIAAAWLGIDRNTAIDLFYMRGDYQREAFDGATPEDRAVAAERVLKILRDEGRVNWRDALYAAGLDEIADMPNPEDDDDESCDCDDCRHSD